MCYSPMMAYLNIAIIGSSGALGGAFVDYFAALDSTETIYALSRSETPSDASNITPMSLDFEDELSIKKCASKIKDNGGVDLVVVATGMLHEGETMPEKSFKHLTVSAMKRLYYINTIGPALIAKHFLPLLPKDAPSAMAFLSARVGSISDNHMGGWHSYRASKAALNMMIRNFAIEMQRTHKQATIIGLHPGTVDSKLSHPFQGNVPDGKLFSPEYSVSQLTNVIENVSPSDSGKIFAYDNTIIEY